MFATGVTMSLAEWIIDDTCLVSFVSFILVWLKLLSIGWEPATGQLSHLLSTGSLGYNRT